MQSNIKSKSKISKFVIFSLLIFSTLFLLKTTIVYAITAQECLDKNPSDLSSGDQDWCSTVGIPQLLAPIQSANDKNKKDLSALQSQLSSLSAKINSYLNQLKLNQADINVRQEKMAYTKELFDQKARDQYTFLRLYDPITPFIFSDTASQAFQEINLRQRAADSDRQTMDQYARDLIKLKNDQDALQKNKDALTAAQKVVSDKATFLSGEVAKASAYLATLSAKQQSFLAAKLASLGISRSAYNLAGGCTDDRNVSPGFTPAIAFFTFGVPNRVGLNQFGAKGRAEAGQNAETILKAYYNADYTTGYNQGINIHVTGTNEFGQSFDDTWNIDDYLKHLYEMPTSWNPEALKAQAIAARSFALSYTNNGAGSICPSQQCQVVKKEINNGAWQAAVDATKGIVMTNGGSPIKAWFSSTHGGYEFTSGDIGWSSTGWTKRLVDTSTGSAGGFSDLFASAYDKSSPMFYCDWGGRAAYNKTAWLKPDEVADMVNVWMLAKADASTQDHLAQTDKPNPDGVDTYDAGRVKSELSNRSVTPFNSVSDVSINADFSSGRTTSIHVSGDAGSKDIPGDEFKNYFNLRAPSNIQIVGPLFNVERR